MTDMRRRTRGAGSVFRDKNGTWHYRRELDRDPATGRPRRIEAKGRNKAEARTRFDAKAAEMERTGLMPGADDYVTKPFSPAELLARVRTAIRHTRTTSANSEIAREGPYTVGEMTIDYNKHQVLVRGENVHLTLSEFRIVALLGKFAGKVLTYDYIIKELWGPRAGGDNQILRVNMANIRRKIEKNPAEPEYLFTEVGVGYRMAENSEN